MIEKHHTDLGKSIRPDASHGELAAAGVPAPDDLGDPGLVQSEQHAPEVQGREGRPTRADGEGGEKKEVREIEPVGDQYRPWIPQPGPQRGAGEYFGANEYDQSDQKAREQHPEP